MKLRFGAAKTPERERRTDDQLSDEDLQNVMGGLSRAWIPFTAGQGDAVAPTPAQHSIAAIQAAASGS